MPVVRAFDRSPLAELPADDAAGLESRLAAAHAAFRDRDGWLPPHRRIEILRTLATLLDAKVEHFAQLIAAEGGKPYTDARWTACATPPTSCGISAARRSRWG